MEHTASRVRWALVVMACLFAAEVGARAETTPGVAAAERLQAFERAVGEDPEDLKLAAEYRQLTISVGAFDRAIDFFERLAKQRKSGPNLRISLAFAYVDKVPVAGDIRRLYLGRDAMAALTQSIARRPSVLAYYVRGVINLYYNRFVFHRADKGVADLTQAMSMATSATPSALVARVYLALGDGYYRLENFTKARETWAAGAARFPEDAQLRLRLEKSVQELIPVVGDALSPDRRVDTSLTSFLPVE